MKEKVPMILGATIAGIGALFLLKSKVKAGVGVVFAWMADLEVARGDTIIGMLEITNISDEKVIVQPRVFVTEGTIDYYANVYPGGIDLESGATHAFSVSLTIPGALIPEKSYKANIVVIEPSGELLYQGKSEESLYIEGDEPIRSVGIQLKNAPGSTGTWHWIWDPMIPDINTVGYSSGYVGKNEIAWADTVLPTFIRSIYVWPASGPIPGAEALYWFQSFMPAAGGYLPKIDIDSFGLYEYDCANHTLRKIS